MAFIKKMQSNNRIRAKSFTLVEILIVLFIISLLATLVTVSVTAVLKKTRDDRRITDINSIASAVDQYATENKRKSPTFSSSNCSTGSDTIKYCAIKTTNSNLQSKLVNYLNPLPADPSSGSGYNYEYIYGENGLKFAVVADKFERDRASCNIPESGSIAGMPVSVQVYISLKEGDRPCYYVAR